MTDADEAPVDITRKNMGGKGGGANDPSKKSTEKTPYTIFNRHDAIQ